MEILKTSELKILILLYILVNTNPDLGLNCEDIKESETLEHVQEQKDQVSNASDETGRTKMSLHEAEYLD